MTKKEREDTQKGDEDTLFRGERRDDVFSVCIFFIYLVGGVNRFFFFLFLSWLGCGLTK